MGGGSPATARGDSVESGYRRDGRAVAAVYPPLVGRIGAVRRECVGNAFMRSVCGAAAGRIARHFLIYRGVFYVLYLYFFGAGMHRLRRLHTRPARHLQAAQPRIGSAEARITAPSALGRVRAPL